MNATAVNPAQVRPGDEIATSDKATVDRPGKTRKVRKVEFCSDASKIHLDGECYDTRFSTIIRKNQE